MQSHNSKAILDMCLKMKYCISPFSIFKLVAFPRSNFNKWYYELKAVIV